MYFIVGLGNPGRKYEMTRHNVGFRVVGRLSEEYRIPIHSKNKLYEAGSGALCNFNVLLVKPLTFMNRSGLVVRQLIDYFHEDASQLIVIHDDLDIPFGQIRIKLNGGAGGHNGLASIMDSLQTDQFLRIRVGIGRPQDKEDAANYVLEPFSNEEEKILGEVISNSTKAVQEILSFGPVQAMNLFNQRKSQSS
ncbi:MAG: aminoacyl-tRNA hydrolase [Nitrospirae bacterium]|nr:aminoacyl-tRNA hydrolase [Nitrospirota bacterium]MBI3594444.1 aminoacyl-tRNA hydrolase [Nitrospirota bacterium]